MKQQLYWMCSGASCLVIYIQVVNKYQVSDKDHTCIWRWTARRWCASTKSGRRL